MKTERSIIKQKIPPLLSISNCKKDFGNIERQKQHKIPKGIDSYTTDYLSVCERRPEHELASSNQLSKQYANCTKMIHFLMNVSYIR